MRQLIPFCSIFLVVLTSPALADDLPKVEGVEAQPLAAQVRRVVESLDLLGQPLAPSIKAKLDEALANPDPAALVRSVQEVLDPLCLVGVTINPESRVKVDPGPARAELVQNGWRLFTVKVRNEAGVTAELRATSPNAARVYRPSTGAARPAPESRRPRSPTAGWTSNRSPTAP